MKNKENYYCEDMPDRNFSVDIGLSKIWELGTNFKEHWHEHLQVFYFINGKGFLRCNTKSFNIIQGDVIIINSRDLHYLESLNNDLRFYLIRIDLPFLFSDQVDLCQTKYLSPLSENLILFKNLIRNDDEIVRCIKTIIKEYNKKEIGYELAVKANLYNLVVLLIRNYIDKFVTKRQLAFKINNDERFYKVFEFVHSNFNKKISTLNLSNIAHVSPYYFCRIFKQITGKTTTEYINEVRLKKSIELLKNSNMNITEVAINCGFNDVNYFSRLFKKNMVFLQLNLYTKSLSLGYVCLQKKAAN